MSIFRLFAHLFLTNECHDADTDSKKLWDSKFNSYTEYNFVHFWSNGVKGPSNTATILNQLNVYISFSNEIADWHFSILISSGDGVKFHPRK